MGTDGHKRVSGKWIASLLQMVLKQHPTYQSIDVKKDLKTQSGVEHILRSGGKKRLLKVNFMVWHAIRMIDSSGKNNST